MQNFICNNCNKIFKEYISNRRLDHTFCNRNCDLEFRKKNYPKKFLKKIIKMNENKCWEWKGQITSDGYSIFLGKPAHRFSYEYFIGKIPNKLFVLHKCDNRSCINPKHLEIGDQKKNIMDCSKRGRINRGENRPHAKLTSAQVLEIRRKYPIYKSQNRLAQEYHVSTKNIYNIIHKFRWKHI